MRDTVWLRSSDTSPGGKPRWRPTLKQLFAGTVALLVSGLAVLFLLLLEGSRRSITQNATLLRDQASRDIAGRVSAHLETAEDALRDIEGQFKSGLLTRENPAAIEAALFARLRHQRLLSELTFTSGVAHGHDGAGALVLQPEERWQVSLFRESPADGEDVLGARRLRRERSSFVADTRRLSGPQPLLMPWRREAGAPGDPTEHATFQTPVQTAFYGRTLWSDLHWSELDTALPPERRRVAISVQQALEDADGRFAGVLRVGLLAGQLQRITDVRMAPPGEDDPHRVFLCDRQGRLISRWNEADSFIEDGDDLRADGTALPPEVRAALRAPELASLDTANHARVTVRGEDFLVSFQALERSQDWVVAIVVPERAYLRDLLAARDRLLLGALLLMGLIMAGGLLTLRWVRRDLTLAMEQTERIRNFQLDPAPPSARIADVNTILEELERSKTSLRGIRKYVPTELVRLLHDAGAEPMLGSELRELTLMFTDLKDFTSVAERLSPNQLAHALGAYLQAMTGAVHAAQGTVDKYIGDAVMAFWNAPLADSRQSIHACEAALRCVEATEQLYRSEAWTGLPALTTRFGLHRAEVLVGHFGAPDRLNYTAIGDGVNAASRLEGLNKEYGTTILVSESVYLSAQEAFRFRLLDAVAVKGKRQSLNVYELLGRAGEPESHAAEHATYVAALALYRNRDFETALQLLRANENDGPSRVLARRCEVYLRERPAENWNGVFQAVGK